jgi:hypothetical protein
LTPTEEAAQEGLGDVFSANPWLVKFLEDGSSDDDEDPNSGIVVILNDDHAEHESTASRAENSSNLVAANPGNGKRLRNR